MANSFTVKDQIFSVGDTVAVHQIVEEGGKKRTQVFEGILIAVGGKEENRSFTVRKVASGGIGVERIYPVMTPMIKKIEKTKAGKARRAKLYYLRGRIGKQAGKVKEKEEKKVSRPKPKRAQPKRRTTQEKSKSKKVKKSTAGKEKKSRARSRKTGRKTASK